MVDGIRTAYEGKIWKEIEMEVVEKLERETGFEPATLALARRCSTTELFPLARIRREVYDYTDLPGYSQAAERGEKPRIFQFYPVTFVKYVTISLHVQSNSESFHKLLIICNISRYDSIT